MISLFKAYCQLWGTFSLILFYSSGHAQYSCKVKALGVEKEEKRITWQWEYTYDLAGRVVVMKQIGEGNTFYISYSKRDSVLIYADSLHSVFIYGCGLDKSGYVKEDKNGYKLTYDGNGFLIRSEDPADKTRFTTYEIRNEDVISVKGYDAGKLIHERLYTYYHEEDCREMDMELMAPSTLWGRKSKHLVKEETNTLNGVKEITTYQYIKDERGRVMTEIRTASRFSHSYYFAYIP